MATTKKEDSLALYIGGDKVAIASDASLLTSSQLNLLASKTPAKYIKKRRGRGGKEFDYVEVNYVVGLLNAIFGFDWSIQVVEKTVDTKSDNVIVLVRLTVSFANGKTITKDAFGGADIKRAKSGGDIIDLADDLKAAESDALKKAASMLGIAWDVYSGLTKSSGGNGGGGFGDDFDDRPAEKRPDTPDEDPLDQAESAEDHSTGPGDAYRNIPLTLTNGKQRMFTKFEAYQKFAAVKKAIGDEAYYEALRLAGYEHCNDIPDKMLPAAFAILLGKVPT